MKFMVKDHLGNEFECLKDMLSCYGISNTAWYYRLERGYTLEEILTQTRKIHKGKVKDHEGREFDSILSMCEFYGVSDNLYRNRRRMGWSVRDSLFGRRACKDHLGNVYKDTADLCKHYGIRRSVFETRISLGWSLEDVLLKNSKEIYTCLDPLGNKFKSKKAMYRSYYRTTTDRVSSRIKRGWSLEKSLIFDIATGRSVIRQNSWKAIRLLYVNLEGEEFWLCKRGSEEEVMTLKEVFNLIKGDGDDKKRCKE